MFMFWRWFKVNKKCAICGGIIADGQEWVWFGFDCDYAHKSCVDSNIIPW